MLLYADEDFPFPVVEELRRLGHDVLTTQADGRTATADPGILARAHELSRAVLTCNRRHYERLNKHGADHSGIISVTRDPGKHGPLAARIDEALASRTPGR